MLRIVKLDKGEFLHEGKGKEIATTEKELEIYDVLISNGKYYTVVSQTLLSKEEYKIGVKEFTPLNKNEMEYQDYITCPYCGYQDKDSWEKGSCGYDIECKNCGAGLEFETEVTVQYHIKLKRKPDIVNLDKEGEE